MGQYFQVKVQFKSDEGKKTSVNYLVDAQSVTEAEARTVKFLVDNDEQSFEVKAASASNIAQVILEETE
jgi:hypothetical protein